MVQATSPEQHSERDGSRSSRGGFRVGVSHDSPAWTASTTSPTGSAKLPPIEWPRTNYRRIMLADLAGTAKSLVMALIMFAIMIVGGMSIAMVLATLLNVLGFDPASLY
jgi:hypothetical protein